MAARIILPPLQIGYIMCKKKKIDLGDELTENVKEIGVITLEEVANCLWEDVPYIVKIGKNLISLPHLIHQEIFWNKFTKFVKGIKSDPFFAAKFATKIANAEDRAEYAKRIITILEKIEEEQKVDYIINATRALCWDQIDRSVYFRICRSIENVYIDDLNFVLKNYDDAVRSDIVIAIECGSIHARQAQSLLKSENALDEIFGKWEDFEKNHMDTVRRAIECKANEISREEFKKEVQERKARERDER